MTLSGDSLSRIDKLFLDRDRQALDVIATSRARCRVALLCGLEVAASATLQAAVLTAANVANRCFPGAVSLHFLPGADDCTLRLPWPGQSLGAAVRTVAPGVLITPAVPAGATKIVLGTRPDCRDGLQVTFDGWVAAVAPYGQQIRLAEQDGCVLAGVAGGALAVSEVFLAFAQVTSEAACRPVGLSLWRPDLAWSDTGANGPVVEFLPAEFWLLGLGHLGQGYLWSLGLLPYSCPGEVNLVLNDFDRVISANVETGLVTRRSSVGSLKTRVASAWLRRRGFQPRLVERKFGRDCARREDEPALALCGFDGGGPREVLEQVGFAEVVECGLGDRFDNFHSMLMHTLPMDGKTAAEIWRSKRPGDEARERRTQRLAREVAAYREYDEKHVCGAVEIAGKGVAVPFVGAIAGSLVMAETLRALHGGERYEAIDLRLNSPKDVTARRSGQNFTAAPPAIAYQRSAPPRGQVRWMADRQAIHAS